VTQTAQLTGRWSTERGIARPREILRARFDSATVRRSWRLETDGMRRDGADRTARAGEPRSTSNSKRTDQASVRACALDALGTSAYLARPQDVLSSDNVAHRKMIRERAPLFFFFCRSVARDHRIARTENRVNLLEESGSVRVPARSQDRRLSQ